MYKRREHTRLVVEKDLASRALLRFLIINYFLQFSDMYGYGEKRCACGDTAPLKCVTSYTYILDFFFAVDHDEISVVIY